MARTASSLGVGSATASNHIVLGDNGTVTYVAMGQMGAGLPLRYETTDTLAATGGDDTISVGDGNNTILGGMGADTITSGNGTDTILGDNGFVQMDARGQQLRADRHQVADLGRRRHDRPGRERHHPRRKRKQERARRRWRGQHHPGRRRGATTSCSATTAR